MDGSMEDVLAKLREASMPKKGTTAGASREPGGAGALWNLGRSTEGG